MKLKEDEVEIFESIKEGISDTYQLTLFTRLEEAHIKNVMVKLENIGLIRINKKFDKYYNDEQWNAELINDRRDLK